MPVTATRSDGAPDGLVVEGAIPEHGHEDAEPAVGDATKGAAVGMAPGAELRVVGLGYAVVLDARLGPVVEGFSETGATALTHDHDVSLAASEHAIRSVRHPLDELPEPRLVGRGRQREQIWDEAMDLLPEPIGQPVHCRPEILVRPRRLPDLDHQRMVEGDPAKPGTIRPERVRDDVGVEPVVFGLRNGVPGPEPVKLLRIERIDVQPALLGGSRRGAAGHLDASDLLCGSPCSRQAPVDQAADRPLVMIDAPLVDDVPVWYQNADLIGRAGWPSRSRPTTRTARSPGLQG